MAPILCCQAFGARIATADYSASVAARRSKGQNNRRSRGDRRDQSLSLNVLHQENPTVVVRPDAFRLERVYLRGRV